MTRYAHTMFCDDVRHEIDGKTSFMGVYSGKLITSDIPGILPKLCIAITLHTDVTEPFKAITVKGVFAGSEVFSMELDEQDILQAESQAVKPPGATGYYVQVMAILTPFQIEKAGKLNLRIIADGEKIRTTGLEIESISPT